MITLTKKTFNISKFGGYALMILGVVYLLSEIPTYEAGDPYFMITAVTCVFLVIMGIIQTINVSKVGNKFDEFFESNATATVVEVASKVQLTEKQTVKQLKYFCGGKRNRRRLNTTSTVEFSNN